MNRSSFIASGAVSVVVGAVAFWATGSIPAPLPGEVGARFFPQVISIVLLLVGLGLLVIGFRHPAAADGVAKASWLPEPATLHVLALATLGMGYVWLIDALGYALATLLVAFAAFAMFGHRSLKRLLLLAVAVTLLYYLIFFVGLGVYDPPSSLIDIRALFQ